MVSLKKNKTKWWSWSVKGLLSTGPTPSSLLIKPVSERSWRVLKKRRSTETLMIFSMHNSYFLKTYHKRKNLLL